MLEQLTNLIRGNAGDAVINNPAIPNEKNEEAVQNAGTSIMSTLQNALAGGNLSSVLNYFKNGSSGSPEIVQQASNNYANELQSKYGLDAGQAQNVANQVVPQSMEQLAAKTADPLDNSFNIQDIFNKLSGGKTGGMNLQALLSKLGGGKLDGDGDGDVDLQDLKGMFTGGSGGGVMDKVKGMFN